MFSRQNSTCGSLCGSRERKRRQTSNIVREGWTEFFLSSDTPFTPKNSKNPGEHEHYFFYHGHADRKRLKVYDTNKNEFTNCKKKAIYIRERETGIGWQTLRKDYTL